MCADTLHTDVLIVGAGPTGLALACQLVRYGVDFIILDQREGVTPYSKALGVHARTLEIYEQLGLAEPAIARGTIADKVRLLAGSRVRGELYLGKLGHGLSRYPYMLVLEQSCNERLLHDYLLAHGKDVRWQTALESFEQSDSGILAQISDANEQSHAIKAAYLVGCDGPKSSVRHSLGLGFGGSTMDRLFYVADVALDWPFSHDALHVCLAQNSGMAFFPMPGERRYRVVGAFPEGHADEEGNVEYAEIEQQLRMQSGIPLTISAVNWFSTYRVHTRHVERFSLGRCFLAGDAAHIHTPAGGQGMNTGIQDGYNLAWKLAFVLKGFADEKILETYNSERLPNAQRLLATTDRMFNLVASPGWLLRLLRTRIIPPLAKYIMALPVVRRRFFPMISQIGICYPDSPLSRYATHGTLAVKAGDRMPYFQIGGANIYTYLQAPKFHCLYFSISADGAVLGHDMGTGYDAILDGLRLPLSPEVMKIFNAAGDFSLLLRPDNHIALIVQASPAQAVANYLQEVVGFRPAD